MQRKFYHPFTLFKLYRREERPAASDSSTGVLPRPIAAANA